MHMQFFFYCQLIFLHCFDCLLPLIICSLACLHAVLLDDFRCIHSKFFSSGSFFHYSPCLLVRSNQNKVSASSETSFCLQLPNSYSCSKHQGHEPSGTGHLECTCFWLSFSLVNITKYFVLPLFEDLSVRSKYCSTALLGNKGSPTRRVSSSTNAIKSAKLGPLLLRFLIASTYWFHLSLICRGNLAIIKHSVSSESRAFQV